MLVRSDILMGRHGEFPLTPQIEQNLNRLTFNIQMLEHEWRQMGYQPFIVTSGYRPGRFNKAAGGAPKSAHLTCEAVDIADSNGTLKTWLFNHQDYLERCGLYMEDPAITPGWCHLQTRRPPSGNRVFKVAKGLKIVPTPERG